MLKEKIHCISNFASYLKDCKQTWPWRHLTKKRQLLRISLSFNFQLLLSHLFNLLYWYLWCQNAQLSSLSFLVQLGWCISLLNSMLQFPFSSAFPSHALCLPFAKVHLLPQSTVLVPAEYRTRSGENQIHIYMYIL